LKLHKNKFCAVKDQFDRKSNAYVIGHIIVKDTEKWNEYRNGVPATLEPWGAELVLGGNWLPSWLVNMHSLMRLSSAFPI
jgi:hypothetical protein